MQRERIRPFLLPCTGALWASTPFSGFEAHYKSCTFNV